MPTVTPVPVAWECANCASTNEGIEPGPCRVCGSIDPIRYVIWKRQGGLPAPTAISARVDRPLQYSLSIAAAHEPAPAARRRADIVAALVGSMVDVVGIRANNRGRKCPRHDCCGNQVEPRMKLKVLKESMRYRGDEEEDVLAVYVVAGGVVGCKVGFLPQHLASRRADDYDGLVLRVREVYTERCTSVVRRNKYHRNEGCAVAIVLGDKKCLEL
jgi:hypothetical protein